MTLTPKQRIKKTKPWLAKSAKAKEERERAERVAIVTRWASRHYGVPEEDINITFYGPALQPMMEIRANQRIYVGPVPDEVCLDLGV